MTSQEYIEWRNIKPTYVKGDFVYVTRLSDDESMEAEERGLKIGQSFQVQRVWQLSGGMWAVDLVGDDVARWAFHFSSKLSNEERMKIRMEELCC